MTRISVVGNHDVAALERDPSGMNPYAGAAAIWTSERLTDKSRSYLLSLGESAKAGEASMTVHHGSLHNISEYLYEDDVIEEMLVEAESSVLVFGHTHVPYVKEFRRGLIVNPGSVGQPRDRDPRASFGILETKPLSCRIVRVPYDIEGASEAILGAGLPRILAERLKIGF